MVIMLGQVFTFRMNRTVKLLRNICVVAGSSSTVALRPVINTARFHLSLKRIGLFRNVYHSNFCQYCTHAKALGIKFQSNENRAAYSVLEAHSEHSQYLVSTSGASSFNDATPEISSDQFHALLQEKWSEKSYQEVLQALKVISGYVCKKDPDLTIENPCFDSICNAMIAQCDNYNYQDFCDVLYCLAQWRPPSSVKSHNFHQLWMALDNACALKNKYWTTKEKYILMDHWYLLNLAGFNRFNYKAILTMSRKPHHSTPQELVRNLFYINLIRKFPADVDPIAYQLALEKCAESLSVEELAICAMGFFKTEKKVRIPHLLSVMIDKTIENAMTINPIFLAAILKVLRSGLSLTLVDKLNYLLDVLLPRIPELPLVCSMHIALATSNVHLRHEGVFRKTCEKFVSEIDSARLKDIERMSFVLSLFNWPAELPDRPGVNLYQLIVDAVRSPHMEGQLERHTKCLGNILHYVSMIAGIYPHDLINKCLGAPFFSNPFSPSLQRGGQEILALDASVEIESPDYTGARLSKRTKWILWKEHTVHPGKWQDLDDMSGSAGVRQIKEMLKTALEIVSKQENVHVGHMIPFYRYPEILICVSGDGKYLPIPTSIKEHERAEVCRPPPAESGRVLCLVMGGWNLLIRGSTEPNGYLALRLRLLSAIGYTPVLVPWIEWQRCVSKKDYLVDLIQSASKNELKVNKRHQI